MLDLKKLEEKCTHVMCRNPKEHQENKCRLCGKPYRTDIPPPKKTVKRNKPKNKKMVDYITKVNKLIDGVSAISPLLGESDTNDVRCPYCGVYGKHYYDMSQLKHDNDCIYLLGIEVKNTKI